MCVTCLLVYSSLPPNKETTAEQQTKPEPSRLGLPSSLSTPREERDHRGDGGRGRGERVGARIGSNDTQCKKNTTVELQVESTGRLYVVPGIASSLRIYQPCALHIPSNIIYI